VEPRRSPWGERWRKGMVAARGFFQALFEEDGRKLLVFYSTLS
jgi:hypothetical protein